MIKVQIGNAIYEIPEVGNPKWGEKTTETLLALVEALSDVVGPEDILTKEALLANNVQTKTPINGLKFDTTLIESCIVTGVIVRTFPEILGLEPLKDTFIIEGANYNGAFDYAVRFIGNNAGVQLFARDDGQFEYTSDDIEFTDSMFIKFSGKAIVSTDE